MQTQETLTRARDYARALPAEKHAAVASWAMSLNGFEPTDRRHERAYAHVVTYRDHGRRDCVAVWRTDLYPVGTRGYERTVQSWFLLDDGSRLRAYWVTGYGPDDNPDLMFLTEIQPNGPARWDGPHRVFGVALSPVPWLNGEPF